MFTVPNSETEILNILKLLYNVHGNGRFATDSHVCKRMPGGGPRTGTFHQTRPAAGDTTCSMKGVLRNIKKKTLS